MISSVSALILAAGKGTRMKSDLPKVLHTVLGKAMLQYVIDAARGSGCSDVSLVIGGDLAEFSKILEDNASLRVCRQNQRRGTGDAVASAVSLYSNAAKPYFSDGECLRGDPYNAEYILVCLGDTPALRPATLAAFISDSVERGADLAVLGMLVPDPTGYGRLKIGSDGNLQKIVEQKDANESELAINLCNSGVIFAKTEKLFEYLNDLTNNNVSGEYYLTDCFEIAINAGNQVSVYQTDAYEELLGVNTPEQLQSMEAMMALDEGRTSSCAE